MATLTLNAAGPTLATIELGTPSDLSLYGDATELFYNEGALDDTSGNLYIYIDGVEYGSLFLTVRDGKPHIELGQFRPETQQWEPWNPLTQTYDELTGDQS